MNLLFVTESDQLDVPENHPAGDIIGDPCVEAADSTTDEDTLQYELGGVSDLFFDYRREAFLLSWHKVSSAFTQGQLVCVVLVPL